MAKKPLTKESLSSLIGQIYECALEPALWDDTLTAMASALAPPDYDVAMLLWERSQPKPGVRFIGATGVVLHAREIYSRVWAGRHIWTQVLAPLPAGRVVDTDQLIPRAELLKSDLYNQFLKAWNMEICVAVILDRDGFERLALAMPGPDGRDLEGLKRGLRLLAPHVQRACRISRRIGEADLRAASAEAALDQAPTAVITLRNDFTIITANSKAQALATSGAISVQGGRFAFHDRAIMADLKNLAEAPPPESLALNITGADGNPMSVLAARLPVEGRSILGGMIEGAALLVSIGKRNSAPLLEIDRLSGWFGLTASEARLAAALAEGKSLSAYALERGISANAARFLLKGVFRKTETHRQSELIGVLRSVPAGP